MNILMRCYFLMTFCVFIVHSTAVASDKLPEEEFKEFSAQGFQKFLDKFSQERFIELGFETALEMQERKEAFRKKELEELEEKRKETETRKQERKEEKRRVSEEMRQNINSLSRLLEKAQEKALAEEVKRQEVEEEKIKALEQANQKIAAIEKQIAEAKKMAQVAETEKVQAAEQAKKTIEDLKTQLEVTQRKMEDLRIALPIALIVRGHEEIYKRFLEGILIYRPKKGSDEGMIKLLIKDLKNPLEGTFDLSQCEDTGKYLSISTGYRKEKKAENENKVEIWFVPRFLIEKELNVTAGHFLPIFGKWKENASVGIFWTWGGWDSLEPYDYLTTENMDQLSNNNLYDKWRSALPIGHMWWREPLLSVEVQHCLWMANAASFKVHFLH